MISSSLPRTVLLAVIAAATLAACDGTGDDAAGTIDTAAAPAPGIVQSGANDTAAIYPSTMEIDTTDGTLQVTGTGKYSGTWDFKDVTGVLEERAASGRIQWILSLEAHDAAQERHFRIRLLRDDAKIEPGRYTFDGKDRKLDAKFEEGMDMFRSLEGATGWVELQHLQDDRARGRFDVTLPTLGTDSSSTQTIKGTFDQKLQR